MWTDHSFIILPPNNQTSSFLFTNANASKPHPQTSKFSTIQASILKSPPRSPIPPHRKLLWICSLVPRHLLGRCCSSLVCSRACFFSCSWGDFYKLNTSSVYQNKTEKKRDDNRDMCGIKYMCCSSVLWKMASSSWGSTLHSTSARPLSSLMDTMSLLHQKGHLCIKPGLSYSDTCPIFLPPFWQPAA